MTTIILISIAGQLNIPCQVVLQTSIVRFVKLPTVLVTISTLVSWTMIVL